MRPRENDVLFQQLMCMLASIGWVHWRLEICFLCQNY